MKGSLVSTRDVSAASGVVVTAVRAFGRHNSCSASIATSSISARTDDAWLGTSSARQAGRDHVEIFWLQRATQHELDYERQIGLEVPSNSIGSSLLSDTARSVSQPRSGRQHPAIDLSEK